MEKCSGKLNIMAPAVFAFFSLACALALLTNCAWAQSGAEKYYPADPDPFMGNWQGRWSGDEEVDPDISAQIIPLGRDLYRIRLASKLFMRSPVLASIEVKAEKGVLAFHTDDFMGEVHDGIFTGSRVPGEKRFEMKKIDYVPPTLGAAPPEGAQVLFDGTGFDAWEDGKGWELLDGNATMVTPFAGDLVSKAKFKDVQMHVEFRTPFMPKERGQSRGNSGVFLQGKYEVQVLDTFGLEGYYDECGALYKVSAPRVNACLPPTYWQTYDITFHAARFNADGSVKAYPRMTVLQNGYVVQQDQEIPQITAWKEKERLQPPPVEPGPIMLQSHSKHYVQYRNVWVVDLGAAE